MGVFVYSVVVISSIPPAVLEVDLVVSSCSSVVVCCMVVVMVSGLLIDSGSIVNITDKQHK